MGGFLNTMNKPNIIAYLKPSCGWSNGVRAVLKKYDLPYQSGEEVEAYLLANKLIAPNERAPEAPINQPCADEMPQGTGIQFVKK